MRTLRARLFALVALTVLVATVATVAIAAVVVRHRLDDQRQAVLARQADALAALAPAGAHVYGAGRRDGTLRELGAARAGRVLAHLPAGNGGGQLRLGRRDLLYAVRSTPRGRVVVVRAPAAAGLAFAPFLRGLGLAGLAGALVAGLVAALLARRLARPLQALAEATRRVAAGERAQVEAGPDAVQEIRALADAFTRMAHDLADARDAERAFLLSVSHELKTPLTAIRGWSEALGEGAVEPREAARVMGAEAERLDRLVRDLLELARADRRGFEVREETVDLRAVALEVTEQQEPRARELGLRLALDVDGPAHGSGDPDRLAQALSNLVENALRVTPTGGTVTIRARDGELSVADTGPGLEAAELPHAFERFYLHDRHRSDRGVGSGLGLAIVAELMRAMGGRAEVRSTPGGGAVFTLHVAPAATPAGVPAPS